MTETRYERNRRAREYSRRCQLLRWRKRLWVVAIILWVALAAAISWTMTHPAPEAAPPAAPIARIGKPTKRPNPKNTGSGKGCVAMTAGFYGRVMGEIGNAIVCVERKDNGEIAAILAGIVDGETLKPGVWYTVKGGRWVEA